MSGRQACFLKINAPVTSRFLASITEYADWPGLAEFRGSQSLWLDRVCAARRWVHFVSSRLANLKHRSDGKVARLFCKIAPIAGLFGLSLVRPVKHVFMRLVNTITCAAIRVLTLRLICFGRWMTLATDFLFSIFSDLACRDYALLLVLLVVRYFRCCYCGEGRLNLEVWMKWLRIRAISLKYYAVFSDLLPLRISTFRARSWSHHMREPRWFCLWVRRSDMVQSLVLCRQARALLSNCGPTSIPSPHSQHRCNGYS